MNHIKVQAPGRINIIGEHTDYNEGFVLPAAIDKTTVFEISKNNTASTVQFNAKNLVEAHHFDLNDFAPLASGWENYVMGVVAELQKLGAVLSGFTASFEGTVPIGSGMSSSAALECSLAFGLNELFDLGLSEFELIKAAQMAEHNFVGIKCGIMDQFASVMGKAGQVMKLDCRSLAYEYFPLELGDYQLILMNTNVSHALASSEYNTRRAECEVGVGTIQTEVAEVSSLRDVDLSVLQSFKQQLPNNVFNRCHHVVTENQRVLDATLALQTADLQTLGSLMYQSHDSLQHDYEVSCPELDYLVDQTRSKSYVLGSRMMGGGFGGCTINIVARQQVDQFINELSQSYEQRFDKAPSPYIVNSGNGAEVIQ